jgi:hypothetical protein
MFCTKYVGAFTVYLHIMSLGVPMKLKTECGVEAAVIFDILITI